MPSASPTPAAAVPTSGGGTISIGGTPGTPGIPGAAPYIPDYKSLIAGDPALQQSEAMLNGQGVANQAQRDAVFQTDATQYGEVPDLATAAKALGLSASDLGGIFTPEIAKLAQQNTAAGTSVLARLGAANTKVVQGIQNALAARGIYNSGETGYQLGQQQQAYTNSKYDALQKLLGDLSAAQGGYLSAEQQRIMALAQALSEAANRAYANYPPMPGTAGVPATTANYVWNDSTGNPVYQDGGGNLYSIDGSPRDVGSFDMAQAARAAASALAPKAPAIGPYRGRR